MVNIHESYINRCIQLAKNGRVAASPNPSVGAVLVYEQRIIGEGYTSPYGGAHAEVNAINSVTETHLIPKATFYVSLEPCSHYGKTPPCADLIISKGIKKVVIGTLDPHKKVAGNGVKRLLEAGCDVLIGIGEEACVQSNIRFITFHKHQRPYIILKWAQTKDGFIAPAHREKTEPVWITGTLSRKLVHKWRSEEQAILVGANTVIQDNPELTTRDWKGTSPTRVVLDKAHSLPKSAKVFNNAATTLHIDSTTPSHIATTLFEANIQSVLIEGGAKTLQAFINAGLWDEARVFHGNTVFGSGTEAPKFLTPPQQMQTKTLQEDILHYYKNTQA